MMKKNLIYHLEMNSKSEFKESFDDKGLVVIEAEINAYQVNRFLYQYIGGPWQWADKLAQSDAQWEAYVAEPNLSTWIAYFQGTIAGYFELYARKDGTTEIAYFGLVAQFIGQGFGGYLLSQAIKSAWAIDGTQRIYVHTCHLDHTHALSNYEARGFKVYKIEPILK